MRIGMIGKIWKMETEEKSNIQINNELKDLQHKFDLLNESYLEKCKNLEDAYVKSQKLLNNTGEIAKIGGWEFNLETRELQWTEEVYRIHEVDADFKPNVGNGINFYSEESKPILKNAIDRIIRYGEPYDLELELITPKKNRRWVNSIGRPCFTNGKITSISGTFQDITEKMIERQRLDKVLHISSLFIDSESHNIDFKKITRTMIEISGAHSGSFNIFEKNGQDFTTVAFDILNSNTQKALKLLGFDVVNKKWKRDIRREKMIKDQTITRFNSLHELTDGVINKLVIKIIEKTFNLGYIYILKISKEEKLLGDFTLFFTKGQKLASLKIVELFANNIGIYLDKRLVEEQNIILNRAVENSPASIVITDANGLIEYVNPQFTSNTGYTFDEAVGQNPRILKSGNMPISVYKDLWDTIGEGKEWRGELENRKKNGEIYWEMASISGIKNDQGIVTHFVAVKEEITGRKHFEDEIKSKNEQLQIINAQKDKFFSIIAHDLRGPFSGFLNLTEILAEDIQVMPLDNVQDLAREMKRSAGNLYDLLSNLLEWSRTQRGLIEFKPEEINMSELAVHAFETFYELAKSKQVSFITEIAETAIAKADRYMIQTIIRNLISNALKFTSSGGTVSFIIQSTKSGELLCAIKDNGIGMPHKILENLFRIDVNVSRTGTNNEPSTGLGLMLCKEFVEKHSGRIWAESKEGNGSTFYFTLPGTI
jgi:PAS domain S-box-containing protein